MAILDYIIVGVYLLAFLGLGYMFKNQKNQQDYFLGGRSFGWFPLSLSVMATQLSAISFISAPAFVGYREGGGLQWLSYEFAVPLAMLFLMVVVLPTLYKSGVVSIYGYLEQRFSRSTRMLLSGVFQISRAFATAVMIYTVALILTQVLDIPFWQTVAVTGIITLVYSLQGGMKAVVYGDMIQMIVLFGGIILCAAFAIHGLGGWSEFQSQLDPARLQAVDVDGLGVGGEGSFGLWPMVIGGFFLYASYYGTDQSQAQRLLSARDLGTAQKTLLMNGLLRFPITLSYCIMGLAVGALALSSPEFSSQVPLDKPDLLIPVFIRDYLPVGVVGLLIVAILSAAMSSLSSTINSLSAASLEDFIVRGRDLSPEKALGYSRWLSLGWGVVCLLLSFFAGDIADTVIEAINKVGSVFYGPILATFIAAVAIPRIRAREANLGLVVGVATNVWLWLGVGEGLFWFWWNATGFVATLGIAWLVSFFRPKASIAPIEIQRAFDVKAAILLLGYFAAMLFVSFQLEDWLG